MVQSIVPVVGAAIVRDGAVLCAQRAAGPLAGWWEFPGGKVEAGESAHAALRREIAEELGCSIRVGALLAVARHDAPHVSIELTTYRCVVVDGEPRALEHAELRWLPIERLGELRWAPADLPTVHALQGAPSR